MEPTLSDINQGVIAVAQNLSAMASGAQARDRELIDVRIRLERFEAIINATAVGVEKLNNMLDGNNGAGLKSRLQTVELRLKGVEDEQKTKGSDRRVVYAMIATFVLSVIGSIVVGWVTKAH